MIVNVINHNKVLLIMLMTRDDLFLRHMAYNVHVYTLCDKALCAISLLLYTYRFYYIIMEYTGIKL